MSNDELYEIIYEILGTHVAYLDAGGERVRCTKCGWEGHELGCGRPNFVDHRTQLIAERLLQCPVGDDIEVQILKLEPLDDVAEFNSRQDFSRPGVVMGADGIVRPYFPPPWLNEKE